MEKALASLLIAAAASYILWAIVIVRTRVPSRARLIFDGYRRARRERESSAFRGERMPLPLTVEDLVAFSTSDGRELRVTLQRLAIPHSSPFTVWYLPSDPKRVTAFGPIHSLMCSAAALVTAVWLVWAY